MSLHGNRAPRAVRAFSLVELIAVIALISVMSIAAAPAMRAVQRSTQQAAAGEVGRTLIIARRFAMSSGEPAGARISLVDNAVSLWTMPSGAATPQPIKGMDGADRASLVTTNRFSGAAIESMRGGNGVAGSGEIWFTPDGEPIVRTGDTFAPFTQDAEIEITGDAMVTIRRSSGAVEW